MSCLSRDSVPPLLLAPLPRPSPMVHAQDMLPPRCSEAQSHLLDAIPHPVWLAGPDGMPFHFNRACRGFTGRTTAELADGGWDQIVHPDERQADEILTDEPHETECRLLRADGNYRWHTRRVLPERDSHGRLVRWVVTYTDVHDRKQAEQSWRRAASVLETTSDGVFALDREWRFTYVNPRAEHLLRRPVADLLGRVIWDEYPDAVGSVFHQEYGHAVSTGRPVEFEAFYRPFNIWVEVRAFPSPDGLTVYLHDISSRKAAEEARVRSEFLLRLVWDDAVDGMRLADADGTVVMVNDAYCRLVGRHAGEIVGRPIADVYAPAWQGDKTRTYLRRFAAKNGPARYEREIVFWDGRRRWVEVVESFLELPGDPPLMLSVFRDVTERHRAEEALRESEERYRHLFEANPHPMWVCDPGSLKFLAVNEAAIARYGYSRDEFLTMTVADIRPPEDVPALVDMLRQNPPESPIWGLRRHRWKDGTVRDVQVASHPIRYGDGIARVVMSVDVTDQLRAEAALRDRETLLRTVIDHIPCGVFWKDRNSAYLGCNELVARNLGARAPDELNGKCDREMPFLPEEAEFYIACDREVMETGQPLLNVEETQTRSDGTHATLLTSKVPLRDAAGTVIGVLGVYLDISARKAAEEAARRSQALFKAFMDNSPVLAFIKDTDGRYLYANRSWEGQFDPPRRDWLGRTDADFWPAEVAHLFREGDRAALASDGPIERLETAVSSSGEPRQFSTLKFPVFDPSGQKALGGIAADVTDQRKLEDQVRQSQKMEAVGRMAGGIAHDFNNILTAVNGFGELALEELRPGDPARDWVAEMVKAGERAAGLTRQLLAFSRKQVLRPRSLDLNGLVADLERMLVRVIGEDIDLATRLDPEIGRVLADPGSIEQVIVNLAVNARDAMPGGGQLTIETREVELDQGYTSAHPDARAGRYVLLAVTDSGCGMSRETRARIFEPFFTTKPVGHGTGLGLSVVHGTVKQAGGHVEVYSEVGVGTTFKVYLPLADSRSRESTAGPNPTLPGGRETVLLVEDESQVRALAAQVLRRAGYTVLEAGNAKEAVVIAGGHSDSLDLVVTDVVMPGGGGRPLAEELTAVRPGLRVLYMSGYTDDAVVRHGVLADRVHFLQKPFTPAGLAAKVREALDAPALE